VETEHVTRLWRGGWKINPHAFGVDNIAGLLLALRQILFSAWVSLNEQKWSTLGERRGFAGSISGGKCPDGRPPASRMLTLNRSSTAVMIGAKNAPQL